MSWKVRTEMTSEWLACLVAARDRYIAILRSLPDDRGHRAYEAKRRIAALDEQIEQAVAARPQEEVAG